MLKSLYTSATGMKAQQVMVDTIANNIANVNTAGFKKSAPSFEDLLYVTFQSPGLQRDATGTPSPIGLQVGSADDPRGISITATHDPRGIRYYPISISADIVGGRLIVKFVYSENMHHPSTISKLRDAFSESLQIFGGSHEEQTARLRRTAAK